MSQELYDKHKSAIAPHQKVLDTLIRYARIINKLKDTLALLNDGAIKFAAYTHKTEQGVPITIDLPNNITTIVRDAAKAVVQTELDKIVSERDRFVGRQNV